MHYIWIVSQLLELVCLVRKIKKISSIATYIVLDKSRTKLGWGLIDGLLITI